jgi:hypothetical protein
MSYTILGNVCSSGTIARTSNRKFLLPNDPVYLEYYTKMWEYPQLVQPNGLLAVGDTGYPESRGAYQGKFGAPHKSMCETQEFPGGSSGNYNRNKSGCTSCSSR